MKFQTQHSLVLLVFTYFALTTNSVHAGKILGLFAHSSESHFAVMRTVITELVRRQHNVTIYSSHPLNERIGNLQEFVIEPEFPFWKKLQEIAKVKSLIELSQLTDIALQKFLATTGALATDYFLSHEIFQPLLQMATSKSTITTQFDYDLIIVDLFYTEALLSLGVMRNIPTIAIINTNFENYMQHVHESILPIGCSPIDFENGAHNNEMQSDNDGFWQRLDKTHNCLKRRILFWEENLLAQENLIEKHFSQLPVKTPKISSVQANVAIWLFNNFYPIAKPRPLLPNTITAGGLQIRPPRELPLLARRFIDEGRAGVIYINFGNEQLCSELSKAQLDTLLKVFAKHKGRFFWICHDADKMTKMPENVMIQHLVPQNDILAHPHVRVFVMNGDLLSLQEAIVRAKPVIGIPIFRNEIQNMQLAEQMGVGIKIDANKFTVDSLLGAIDAIIKSEDYSIRIRQLSKEFRDRPFGALETFFFWIDYVIRNNGGMQLKTRGIATPVLQLHLIELFGYYLFGTLLPLTLILIGLIGVYSLVLHIKKKRENAQRLEKIS